MARIREVPASQITDFADPSQKNTGRTLGALFPKFFANLNDVRDSTSALNNNVRVVKKHACKPCRHQAQKERNSRKARCTCCGKSGVFVNGVFKTFSEKQIEKEEINKRKDLARKQALLILSNARMIDVEGLRSLKSNGNFDGVFKSLTEKELYNKLNSDEFGASFLKMIVQNKVKINFPVATKDELIALQKGKPLPAFSLLN